MAERKKRKIGGKVKFMKEEREEFFDALEDSPYTMKEKKAMWKDHKKELERYLDKTKATRQKQFLAARLKKHKI